MAHRCGKCGTVVYRRVYSLEQKVDIGVECGCIARGRQLPDSAKSAFSIEFDHVHDAFGNKVKVENIKQLEQAQKTYGFQSVVLNADAQNFDDPPQQRRLEVADIHRWRHSSLERYRENQGRRR